MSLAALVALLRESPGLQLKRDIQQVASALRDGSQASIRNGDDAAAIPDGDGHMLIAAEGMLPSFVERDPWFAGFCAVMVNVSDIAAMGGTAYAVVDVLFSGHAARSAQVLEGMRAASRLFGVPVVGGHTSRLAEPSTVVAAAIVGRARSLITSFDAKPDDQLLLATDLRGAYRAQTDYFDAASQATAGALREMLQVLPTLAERGLTRAGKDVSMAGIAGTLVMLCEGSGVGAVLDLDALPRPGDVSLSRWLRTFPSYGFLLAVSSAHVAQVRAHFAGVGVSCAAVGVFDATRRVRLHSAGESALFWDLTQEPLTGFSASAERA